MENVFCPFCDHEVGDPGELFIDSEQDEAEEDVECEECGKAYKITRHIRVWYSTEPDKDFEQYLDRHPETREQLNRLRADNEAKLREYNNAQSSV